MIKSGGTGGAGGFGPVCIANGGAGCEHGSGVYTPGSGGSGGNGRFIWSRTEDGSAMRLWQNAPTCCQTHNLRLIQKRGTEIYHKCYVCGRDWTEPLPVNPMEAVKINQMPTKWENGKKTPPIPEGAIIVHL
nr:MAG TPA: hypothetical protein [Caudoviricetes sp.]